MLKQLLYHSLQLFTSVACDTFRSSQVLLVAGAASNGAAGAALGMRPQSPRGSPWEPYPSDCVPRRWPGGQGRNG